MKQKIWLHKEAICFLLLLLCGILFNGYVIGKQEEKINNAAKLQQGIAENMIRFHVIANSNTKEDQALKIKVKNEVVKNLQDKLKDAKSLEEARNIISENLEMTEKLAEETMQRLGYSYQAKVDLGPRAFPVKMYGDMVFPAGEYEALQVKIGKAQGKNWWCVMFPTLCFIDGTYSVVPEESKAELETVLTEEEYQSLFLHAPEKITAKWKISEWWNHFFNGKKS